MSIEDIMLNWTKDARLDPLNIEGMNLRIPPLMAKYSNLLALEKAQKRLLQAEYKKVVAKVTDVFTNGTSSRKEYEQWQSRLPAKVGALTKTELENYVASDEKVIELSLKLGEQDEKIDYLKDVLVNLKQWTRILSNVIDIRRYENGA